MLLMVWNIFEHQSFDLNLELGSDSKWWIQSEILNMSVILVLSSNCYSSVISSSPFISTLCPFNGVWMFFHLVEKVVNSNAVAKS